jgi:hypothetical protein
MQQHDELKASGKKHEQAVYPLLMYVNRVALYVNAHAHILSAFISQRNSCFSEQVRLLFVVNMRRFKQLVSEQFRIIWLAYQGTQIDGTGKDMIVRSAYCSISANAD